jgi:hypothetical protein
MKLDARPVLTFLSLPLLAVLAVTGCDLKLTGTDGGGDPNPNPNPVVTPEALAVGNILALHVDLLHAGIAVAANYDTAAAPEAWLRGVVSDACWSLTETDAVQPIWALRLDSCVDGHGTTYQGGGEFAPVDTLDGFAFFPWGDVDLIRAINAANDEYNHDVNSGSLEFSFVRGVSGITAVEIDKYLRHNVHGETVTFTYQGVHYTGALGSVPEFPDADSVVRVVWDGVGIFDVNFETGGQATYLLQGTTYRVNLATGDVTIVAS